MILNTPTVVALFLAAIGCLLGLAASVLGLWGWRAGSALLREERAHLVLLVLVVLGVVRLLDWPWFYFVLASYVEPLAPQGVMCVYGVARVQAELAGAVQLLKPALLWSVALWLLLAWAERRAGRAVFVGWRLAAAIPVGVVALADGGVELAYLLADKLGEAVTCCSQAASVSATVLTSGGPAWVGRAGRAGVIAYVATHALAIAGAAAMARGVPRRGTALGLALLAPANLIATYVMWAATLAPRVLGLPYHHCAHELLVRTPALALAALAAVGGSAALASPLALQIGRRRAADAIAFVTRRVYGVAATLLATEALIVALHLI